MDTTEDNMITNDRIKTNLKSLLDWPIVFWVLVSFLIAYYLFFICPTYFSSSKKMQFIEYIPALKPIGIDLQIMRGYGESWRNGKYEENFYPPFATAAFFAPLSILEPSTAYQIVTITNYLGYILVSFVIPILINRTKASFVLVLLLFTTGLYSYGFLFELERGQLNLIAFLLCMFAIYLFHYHNKIRYLAYILFAISIQLKVWPGIFILMFVHDWRDWRINIKRFLGIVGLNSLLLFVLGYQPLAIFLQTLSKPILNPYTWVGNHSIMSFMTLFAPKAINHLQLVISEPNLVLLGQIVLISVVGLCFLLIVNQAYKKRISGFNPYLLLACTLGALLIPSTSHDYKISILASPMAIVLARISLNKYPQKHFIAVLLILFASLAYSSTLFSYTNKPSFLLQNNLPALMVILTSLTVLALLRDTSAALETESHPE
jgi:hypothetical protein